MKNGDVVFREGDIGIRNQGESVTYSSGILCYGMHTNPYTLQATQRLFDLRRNRHLTRSVKNAPIIDTVLMRVWVQLLSVNHTRKRTRILNAIKYRVSTNGCLKFEPIELSEW